MAADICCGKPVGTRPVFLAGGLARTSAATDAIVIRPPLIMKFYGSISDAKFQGNLLIAFPLQKKLNDIFFTLAELATIHVHIYLHLDQVRLLNGLADSTRRGPPTAWDSSARPFAPPGCRSPGYPCRVRGNRHWRAAY
jgi:hypothetical protein